jgi:hypothetical protein
MPPVMVLVSPDEPQRLAAVRRYDILDTPPDGAFDRITALAARRFNVPIAIVSIVDRRPYLVQIASWIRRERNRSRPRAVRVGDPVK